MRKIAVLFVMLIISVIVFSQDMTKFKLYTPGENAEQKIAGAIKKAKKEGKHVFIQIGGNWCIWCARFNEFVTSDKKIDSIMKADYVFYAMNHSQEDPNKKLLAKYNYPQRFGFPVFIILNGEGKLIHTQTASYLGDGKDGYDRDKVYALFRDWKPAAFDPNRYKE
ncbi:MAG TPA: thioredoxin family protein [Chitinophagaceae bacterium]|jgi:thioredoxin-related protein|nr:thioredoxin family protein [Chitinophagaceae bacterium]